MRDLIVDGYNVLHAVPRYADVLGRDLAGARDRLVDDVASFAAGRWRATVVFDGVGEPGEIASVPSTGGVAVRFAPRGVDADTIVEELARRARDAGDGAVVVTSDASTQWTVRGGTVAVMSAREFAEELAEDAGERTEHLRAGPRKSTVDQRIDDATRSALLRLRDSRG